VDQNLLAVALARSTKGGRDRPLAVGGVLTPGEDSGFRSDPLASLIETLA